VFDVFDLHTLTPDQMTQIIDLINSFGVIFNAEADSVFWQLQLAFKKLILNAKQLSFFQVLKTTMEEETWTAEDLTEEGEAVIRSVLAGTNFELFSKFVRVDDTRYFLSRSFLMLLTYISDLIQLQENIGSVGTEFFTKIEKAVDLYLSNMESLLVNTGATQHKKVTKINTKMLGKLSSAFGSSNQVPGPLPPPPLQQERGGRGVRYGPSHCPAVRVPVEGLPADQQDCQKNVRLSASKPLLQKSWSSAGTTRSGC
jgi:hypothetical protein